MTLHTFNPSARALRLLAATALIGLAGAAVQTAHAAPDGIGGHREKGALGGPGTGMPGPGQMGPAGPQGDKGHMGHMLDRVGASAEQKAQINALMEAAHNDIKPVRAQMKTLHEQGSTLFTQRNVDANAVEAARLQMQTLQGQVSKRMSLAQVESSRVLTPEERTQMADLMNRHRAMVERHRAEADLLMGPPGAKK